MKAMIFVVILLAVSLTGCASLNSAGTASYTIKPMMIDGRAVCCEVSIVNGKEIAELDAVVEKSGDSYTVVLRERGVSAFKGQALAASAATAGTKAAATTAGAVMMAPAVAGVGAAAIGALAR